jgi:chromosome segregation ATPase
MLDYDYTCPDIDKNINELKDIFKESIKEILIRFRDEKFDNEEVNQISEDCALDLYSDFEDYFENVRKTNEDLRNAANDQIDTLKASIETLEYEIEEKEKEIETLNYNIGQLESEIRIYLKG